MNEWKIYSAANLFINRYSDSDEVPKIEEQGIQKDSLVDLSIHNIKWNIIYLLIKAILKYAFESKKVNPNSIIVHGRSLGGAVLAYGVANHAPNKPIGCIFENTFTSMDNMVDVIVPKLTFIKKLILKNHWPTI